MAPRFRNLPLPLLKEEAQPAVRHSILCECLEIRLVGGIRGGIGGGKPSCTPRGLRPCEPLKAKTKTFLRRKNKKHSAPSRWSGLSMTRQKENEQNLPELAPGRQPTAAPKIAFGTGTA